MQTWLAPFIYLAVLMAMYLFAPSDKRSGIQRALRKDPNFYLICDIVLIAVSIPATLTYRQAWLDYLAWGLLVVLSAVSLARMWKLGTTPAKQRDPDNQIL